MKTKDLPKEKIEILKSLFPSCIIDNKLDFELLKQELTDELLDERKEKYQLTWPGKKESITLGNQVTTKTLRPVKEKLNQKGISTMAEALRKTIRKKKSKKQILALKLLNFHN